MLNRGFTLVELLVVLIIMGLAAGIAAPAFLPPPEQRDDLGSLTQRAQEIAARRAETVHLAIDAAGAWELTAASSNRGESLSAGRLGSYDGPAARLVISPLGTCGLDRGGRRTARALRIDPLTCEVHVP